MRKFWLIKVSTIGFTKNFVVYGTMKSAVKKVHPKVSKLLYMDGTTIEVFTLHKAMRTVLPNVVEIY
jgi:hypothetical protein